MLWHAADLHIHTALSPCADDMMSPGRIVSAAAERGISIIAVTDHNASGNVRAVRRAAEGSEVVVLAGMEIQAMEEVHVLSIFDSPEQAEELERTVWAALPEMSYRPDVFGRQVLFGPDDSEVGECAKPLMASTKMTISEVAAVTERLGGLFVYAHVDRPAFGVVEVLGLVPEDVGFDAVEATTAEGIAVWERRGLAVVSSSDAHCVGEIGVRATAFLIEKPCIEEIRMALNGHGGRRVVVMR